MNNEKYKPFNIEEARKGAPCITRDGREAKLVYVSEFPNDSYPFLFVYPNLDGNKFSSIWIKTNGRPFEDSEEYALDIFMLPKTKTYWVNIYEVDIDEQRMSIRDIHLSEHSAKCASEGTNGYLKTISFDIEDYNERT